MTLNGIDVSGHQPKTITTLVDYDFVIIKATEGTSYVSAACDAQYQAAKKAGKLLGVYHYASGGDPVAEANWFIKNIRGYLGEAILILDDEANAAKRGDAWSDKFVRQVKTASGGYGSVVYASASVLKGLVTTAKDALTAWDADWGSNPTEGYKPPAQVTSVGPWSSPRIRQYTSNGTLPGYTGRLDLDVFYGTAADWHALAAKGASAPAPVVVVAPVGRNITSRPTKDVQRLVGATPDGIYGRDTTAAVQKWQAAHGLTADGIWGPKSDAAGFPSKPAAPAKLAVDGAWGTATCKAEQRALGVNPDGVEGPQTIRAEQKRTGARVDGARGPDTNRHLQQHLNSRIGAKLAVDGARGPDTVKALQNALNMGKF